VIPTANDIRPGKELLPRHTLTVDERAIGAAVDEQVPLWRRHHFRMAARDVLARDHDIAARIPTNEQ
jgi:hypothetical protein